MLEEVAKLTVHRHEVLRPRERDHLLEILLARVAGHVDEGDVFPEHLRAALEEGVDRATDHALIAGDDARREDDQVARPDLDVLVLPRGAPPPGRGPRPDSGPAGAGGCARRRWRRESAPAPRRSDPAAPRPLRSPIRCGRAGRHWSNPSRGRGLLARRAPRTWRSR